MKPILKWVGGKQRLLDAVFASFPASMNNYIEPFVGGGSVLLRLLELEEKKEIEVRGRIYAYDINPHLIALYQHVQSHPRDLGQRIAEYMAGYESAECKKAHYYQLRATYNAAAAGIDRSALFVVLNKLCFRGMYRESASGFNVPFGHYKKTPKVPSIEELEKLSAALQRVVFAQADFRESLPTAQPGDFLYCDPPYYPLKKESFTGYCSSGFDEAAHDALFQRLLQLSDVSFALSNADVPYVTKLFGHYNIKKIRVTRAINAKNPGSTAGEVIIDNLRRSA
jgi:DNA adenine methylase